MNLSPTDECETSAGRNTEMERGEEGRGKERRGEGRGEQRREGEEGRRGDEWRKGEKRGEEEREERRGGKERRRGEERREGEVWRKGGRGEKESGLDVPPQDLQQLSHPVEVLRLINKTAERQQQRLKSKLSNNPGRKMCV